MPNGIILIVDDEMNTRQALSKILEEDGYGVLTAADGYRAIDVVTHELPDLVLTDLKMPGMDGIELLTQARLKGFDMPFLMLTAHGSVETALEAMKKGAEDFLTKPVNIIELEKHIDRILSQRKLMEETKKLRDRLHKKYKFQNMVGHSPPMQAIFKTVEQVASSHATVLVTGESGTGKGLIASAIHQNGARNNQPYVKVSCSAFSESLIESELFGHEKGAFTDAYSERRGRFETADGGTLFLDEFGDLSPSIQVKLLGFLQDREFERVGGNTTIKVDVRLIAATNIDVERSVELGTFRHDLYYRLNVVRIEMPPLRERLSDIPLLVKYFISKFAKENDKRIEGISSDALSALMSYSWPGNVRELENMIENAVVLCDRKTIGRNYFRFLANPCEADAEYMPPIPGSSLETIERYAIKKALEAAGGNRSKAAQKLKISLRKIQYKLKDL
jgi:DNA-binding NtrC family response regulator